MCERSSFKAFFQTATGHAPFPWQTALFRRFAEGETPRTVNIPTGLGKTSIVAVWLIALALHSDKVPRRLVYVVNRRTVVDQTTAEVEHLRKTLVENPELRTLADHLRSLCALPLSTPDSSPLAVSTLRGQFADNREWSSDPARPAVIVGTVDMIGSGLLFSRYTVGFKLRPHHAAFLAQDALLVHDEAHLEPAFQRLLESIVAEQFRSNDPRRLRVMELSATTRESASPVLPAFGLTEDDRSNEFVRMRVNAVKRLSLLKLAENEKLDGKLVALALERKDSGRTELVFARSVEAVVKVAEAIRKAKLPVVTLTGTMRGKERDELVSSNVVFQRFLPSSSQYEDAPELQEGTVFLVATSAGEVGVNISADDLICDLSTYESMAQRFGRVNRFGECDDSTITVVYPQEFQHTKKIRDAEQAVVEGKKDAEKKLQKAKRSTAFDIAIENTFALLQKLGGDASPAALEKLPVDERATAFSPLPEMRIATGIQFDAWALTSVRTPIAARPPVAPYLHGEAEWEPPETHVAWREEVDVIRGELLKTYPPEDLLDDFPLKPHELLRDTTDRIVRTLGGIMASWQSNNTILPDAWLLKASGAVEFISLQKFVFANKAKKVLSEDEKRELDALHALLADSTLILPASVCGIKNGMLSPDAVGDGVNADVAEITNTRIRIRTSLPSVPDAYRADYRIIKTIDTQMDEDDPDSPERYWLWLEAKSAVSTGQHLPMQLETLEAHSGAVTANASAIAERLLSTSTAGEPDLRRCLITAARLHDLGKNRRQWQLGIGNTGYNPTDPEAIFAKSGASMHSRNLAENYRHEFGSLIDAVKDNEFAALSSDEKEIVMHLVAAHHGRARPHFPAEEIFDYASTPTDAVVLATAVPRRFGRLQRRFGRWGLAWLESLLRAADYAASAGIVANGSALLDCPCSILPENNDKLTIQQDSKTMITLRVDVSNPGQYFACGGLFELAARLAPDALAHFVQDVAAKQWRFVITDAATKDGEMLTLQSLLDKIVAAEITNATVAGQDSFSDDTEDEKAPPLQFDQPFDFRLDWWETASSNTAALKVWAGSMDCLGIACAMQNAIRQIIAEPGFAANEQDVFYASRVVYEANGKKKKEPFYFDANRGPNADSRDVGFAPNDLKLETVASPIVELLCLVGLQRAIPVPEGRPRQFVYSLWTRPLPATLLAVAVNGLLPDSPEYSYRFESWFRTSQKKHKAFLQAIPISQRTNQ
jgi:CRISPR-associated endonuclease/helicase Cas3